MRLLTGLLLVAIVSMLSHPPLDARAAPTRSSTVVGSPAATVEQEIQSMETRWNDARARADVATLDRILVDDWTVTHANGTTDSKTQYLADLRSGARKFGGPVTVSDFAVRSYGDTAVASGSSQSTVTLNGQPQGGALHFTRVYVKRNGAWRMIVTQATQRQ
jgi:ketosteroid isomerase-like protein